MVNVASTRIDKKGRIQLPGTFLMANNLRYGDILVLKPMVNKTNSVAIVWKDVWKERNEKTNK